MMLENLKQWCYVITAGSVILGCLILYFWINTGHLHAATNHTHDHSNDNHNNHDNGNDTTSGNSTFYL